MKQIVDKLNKIAKKINENVELSDRDLIIDSLDSITKAYGGTPNDSTLIVDKLDDIYNNVSSAPSGNIEITENGENINVAPYATATVNVSGGGGLDKLKTTVTITNNEGTQDSFNFMSVIGGDSYVLISSDEDYYITLEPIMTYAGETLAYGQSIEQDWYYYAKANPFEVVFLQIPEASVSITTNNMTRVENNGAVGYRVTDMTANSSFNITVNSMPK